MKTSSPISTICYQSIEHLKNNLDFLVSEHFIDFYAFVEHLPEDNELKEHKHLLVFPNGRIDTTVLDGYLIQANLDEPDKPYKNIWWQKSKPIEWVLYCTHNIEYCLATNSGYKKYQYDITCFISSDYDGLQELFLQSFHSQEFAKYSVAYRLVNGEKVSTLVKEGVVTINDSARVLNFAKLCYVSNNENIDKELEVIKNDSKSYIDCSWGVLQ